MRCFLGSKITDASFLMFKDSLVKFEMIIILFKSLELEQIEIFSSAVFFIFSV